MPPTLTPLDNIRRVVLASPVGDKERVPVWRLTQASWNTAWGSETFGVQDAVVDITQFRFRVSPDADRPPKRGKSPFLVEAYEQGFPIHGIRRDGYFDRARPLGFHYDARGDCDNLTVRVLRKGRWTTLRLSKRQQTLLGIVLAYNEYGIGVPPAPVRKPFGDPWIRITARGYGDYWIARNLECVGPFGAACELLPAVEDELRELLGEKPEKKGDS